MGLPIGGPSDSWRPMSRKAEDMTEAEPTQDAGEPSRDTSSESDTTAREASAGDKPSSYDAEFHDELRHISRGMLARVVLDSKHTGGPLCSRGGSSVNSKTRNTPRNPASVAAIAVVALFLALLGVGVAVMTSTPDSTITGNDGTFHMR